MTNIKCRFEFHPVGQGLFYSGTINEFNFVYDCGTSSSRRYLTNAINAYNVPQKLDMLVISHFHKDHINGITELLEKTTGVKDVIMPFLHPEEQFLLLANYRYESDLSQEELENDEYFQFLKDPAGWFSESAERVIVIQSEPVDKKVEQDEQYLDSDQDFYWTNAPLRLSGNIYHQDHHELFDSFYWQFKFYCNDSKVAPQDIRYELDALDIDAELSGISNMTPDQIYTAKGVYWDLFGRSRQNDTTLVCYHGPKDQPANDNSSVKAMLSNVNATQYLHLNELSFRKGSYHRNLSVPCREMDNEGHFGPCRRESCPNGLLSLGQMLTGDAKLQMRGYGVHFQKELDHVGIFLIPHHGSIHNWQEWFKDVHSYCAMWVCSARLGRSCHPDQKVVDDIKNSRKTFIQCDESQGVIVSYYLSTELWNPKG